MCLDRVGLACVSHGYSSQGTQQGLTVCAVPAFGKRFVVVGGRVGVHELSSIVCIVARILQPDRQILVVPSFGYEFWITSCGIGRSQRMHMAGSGRTNRPYHRVLSPKSH